MLLQDKLQDAMTELLGFGSLKLTHASHDH